VAAVPAGHREGRGGSDGQRRGHDLDGPRHRARGKRVRIVSDEAKYRRHRRKKWLRKGLKITAWVGAFVLVLLVMWFLLNRYTQPPPQE
jgi:hypothetical protein